MKRKAARSLKSLGDLLNEWGAYEQATFVCFFDVCEAFDWEKGMKGRIGSKLSRIGSITKNSLAESKRCLTLATLYSPSPLTYTTAMYIPFSCLFLSFALKLSICRLLFSLEKACLCHLIF